MTLRNLIDDLRHRHDNHPSLEDQVKAVCAHYWVGTQPDDPNLSKSELEDTLEEMGLELDHNTSTVVSNLNDAEILDGETDPSNPDWWVIRERDGEFPMGDDMPPAVHEEINRAKSHVQSMDPRTADGGQPVSQTEEPEKFNEDGETLREEVADHIGTESDELETYLDIGIPRSRREKLNEVVEAIEESDEFEMPDTFGKIELIPDPVRYHFTSATVRDYNLG
ncbi:hypothetical protein B4589_006935 [Halolamina sp. CBA1230]|uniref:hypothetical protein n=1 Tax=Halolamina sp. CBA1230 TaxID=1853690 RepID=UPI0009A142DA|nr:hypothetical protein [Halolamina sp. CBA1230]QKY20126.1 hypothetical protein B4589_006935 [Halolamina sp. CBA1230]